MLNFWRKQRLPTTDSQLDDAADAMGTLITAAREDPAFKQQVLNILNLPLEQREPIINSAVAEMSLRGESASAQAAFRALATDEGASLAARLIRA